jgi:choline-sulfatase
MEDLLTPTRRELLQTAAGAVPAVMLGRLAGPLAEAAAAGPLGGMNVLVFLTDQERAIQHFPDGWAARNLPGDTCLRRNGLVFENAFTNACMCSPARSTWMTGFFPSQHRVKYTLEQDMSPPRHPQVQLATGFKNIASVVAAAGYDPVYKGKWHLDKPDGPTWAPSDVGKYGFPRWNPPDAGANQDLSEAGGGSTNNDGRFMDSVGSVEDGSEGVLQYLGSAAAGQQPFFLVVSLVNPHDVLFYPSTYQDAGYDDSWLKGEIGVPATFREDLSTKPTVQKQFLRLFNLSGRITTRAQARAYLNFYGNLIKSSDAYLVRILDKLKELGLYENTLVIKTSDHGEMGLTHGGLRQKNFNFYEEALRVPLVYSNPKLYPAPRRTKAMVSHVDFVPTLANLVGAPRSARAPWQGVDYSRLVLNPSSRPTQDYVVFTYDDYQSGQKTGPYPDPPNHVVSIREERYKLAQYYDPEGKAESQWEMYDLKRDPLERRNLAWPGTKRTQEQERQYRRLRRRLARVKETRLRQQFRRSRAA